MREPFLTARPKFLNEGGSETPQAFRKIPNRSGGAGKKGVKGERNPRPALAFRASRADGLKNG
ncbi:MAG: hypothetical protein KGI39_03740 [Patescibacteria group bacterium]|nr:hypothetical protein [Patescibacteria group bacterium]